MATANAWITGSPEDPVLNFELPAGPAGKDSTVPGPQGDTGERGPIGPVGPQGEVGPAGKDWATINLETKPSSERPDVYPVGISLMENSSLANNWPAQYVTIQTVHTGNMNRVFQTVVEKDTARTWTRTGNHVGLYGWSPFMEFGVKGAKGDTGPTGATGEQGAQGIQGEQGLKGDKGGWDNGSDLGTTVLDTIFTPGLYRQWNANNATTANGYPSNSSPGVLQVSKWSGEANGVLQEFTKLGSGGVTNSPQRPRITYKRYYGNMWSDWTAHVSQRVDNTAGRAVYTWDDVNNREQMIYADSGWRDITTMLNSDYTATKVTTRRVGHQVFVNFDGIKSPTESGHSTFMTPAEGFKPDTVAGLGNMRYAIATELTGVNGRVISPENNTYGIRFLHYVAGQTLHGSFSYFTREPWPTTLPGIAVGTVPTN